MRNGLKEKKNPHFCGFVLVPKRGIGQALSAWLSWRVDGILT